ncbi:hypothetical protein BDV18DRAFT_155237 [Aspergillus unguis]
MGVFVVSKQALILMKILNRSISFGTLFSCISSTDSILEYYLPIWLQVIKALSAISPAVKLQKYTGTMAASISSRFPEIDSLAALNAGNRELRNLVLAESLATIMALCNQAIVKMWYMWYLSIALAAAFIIGGAGHGVETRHLCEEGCAAARGRLYEGGRTIEIE